MFRIDVPTAAGVIPVPAAAGTPGYFTNGNPGTSTPATIVDQDFLNMIQEELYAIATALGAAASKTTRNQCLTAIQQMIQQQTGNFATDTGAADAYVGTYVPAIAAYTNGMVLRLFIANANLTTTPTFNAGAGAQTILREDGSAIVAGDLPASTFATFEYRSATTKWYLLSVSQNVAAIAIQQQLGNYATAGGTANALTATYAPVVTAHIAGQPLRVKIASTNSTGGVTFNPGPGVKTVVAPDGSALVAGELLAGNIVNFIYDGTNYIAAIARSFGLPAASGLIVTNDATTPDTKISVAADQAILSDSIGRCFFASAVNISTAGAGAINLGVVGANGIDAGAQAASTWYHAYIIAKADGTIAGLASLSATAPAMPTGYIFKMRVGAMRSGGATTLLRTKQVGNRTRYIPTATTNTLLLPQMVAPANSQTRVAIAIGNFVPPTAISIAVVLGSNTGTNNSLVIAPNNDAGYGSTGVSMIANPTPGATFGGGGSSVENGAISVDLLIESTNIYYSSGASAVGNTTVNAYGWNDKVNAS